MREAFGMWACIVSDHEPSTSKIQQVLANEGPEAARVVPGEQAVDELPRLRPKLIVLALGPDPERGLTLLGEMRLVTDAHIVCVGPEADSKLVLRAMHA